MDEQKLREAFAERLRACATPATVALAEVIVVADGPPCWGHIADEFDALCTRDEDRILVFRACKEVRDLSAILLFIEANRARPAVVAAIAKEAQHLPFTAQCALASIPEAVGHTMEAAGLHPAATELVAADDEVRRGEHAVYAAYANALRSHRTRASSHSVPSTEVPEAAQPGGLP